VPRVLSWARRHRWGVGLAGAVAAVLAMVHLLDPPWSGTAHELTMSAAVLVAWAGVFAIRTYRWTAAGVAATSRSSPWATSRRVCWPGWT
jgi:hypothetical protein